MMTQNYANHSRFPASSKRVLPLFLLLVLVGAILNLYEPLLLAGKLWSVVLMSSSIAALIMYYSLLSMVIKVQDRAIRAEENFRHFVLTGKPLPQELSVKQIVALRFASDLELSELANRAVTEKLSRKAIKKLIQIWRPDLNRAQ